MKKLSYISARQLFTMLIVFRIVIIMTINSILMGGNRLLDNLMSCAIAFTLNFVLVLPIYFLNRRSPRTNILEKSYDLFGPFGAGISMFYALYFIFVDCYYLSFFHIFTVNVLDPYIPFWLIAVSVMAVAVYGAFQGIEALARTALLILVVILTGMLFLFITVIPRINLNNLYPLWVDGTDQMWTGVLQVLGRSTCFPIMAMLLPQVSGRKKLGFLLWNLILYLFMAIGIFVLVSSLGSYVDTQLFPFFSLASIAGVRPFQRMDAIFIGVWLSGLFLKIATDLYLVTQCCIKVFGQRSRKISTLAGAVLIAGGSVLISSNRQWYQQLFSLKLTLPLTITAALALPIVMLMVDLIKYRKGKRQNAKQAVQNDSA